MQAYSFFTHPQNTPKAVRWLILITAAFSLLSPIATFFLQHILHSAGPGQWLSLSLFGLKSGWFWEPLSYILIQSPATSLSLSSLLALSFNLLVLWFTASEIALRFGTKSFFLLYLGASLFSGLTASFLLWFFLSPGWVAGIGPPLFALVVLWAMLYSEHELFFFFTIRLKVKWLAAIYLILSLLTQLSDRAFISFCAHLAAMLFGFSCGKLIWKLKNPFPLNLRWPWVHRKKNHGSKIIDINSFRESDDAFMDRMLDKIAKNKPISDKERQRMHTISRKKSGRN